MRRTMEKARAGCVLSVLGSRARTLDVSRVLRNSARAMFVTFFVSLMQCDIFISSLKLLQSSCRHTDLVELVTQLSAVRE